MKICSFISVLSHFTLTKCGFCTISGTKQAIWRLEDYPVVFIAFTSDDLSSCVWLALQEWQQHRRLIRTVHARLNRLLKHCVDWSWTEVVRELLHQFSVKMRAIVTVLVHVDAHWNDTKTIKHWNNFTNLNVFAFFPLTVESGWKKANQPHIHEYTIRHQLLLLSNLPVQTTFEPLLWLFSAETWLELSRVSGGGAVTDDAPRDGTTRGFFWSEKNKQALSH